MLGQFPTNLPSLNKTQGESAPYSPWILIQILFISGNLLLSFLSKIGESSARKHNSDDYNDVP